VRVVVKVGSSSVTATTGELDVPLLERLAAELVALGRRDHEVVLVSSGAVAAGRAVATSAGRSLGPPGAIGSLQALSALGQHRLMAAWDRAFGRAGGTIGQILLTPLDFAARSRYLLARQTLERLLGAGVVPVVNENDAVADDELRFGDNDHLAALTANLLSADLLVLLTDAVGLLTADPRGPVPGTLVEEVTDAELARASLGGPGSAVGRGGMVAKLAAARMAAWSGVRTVIGSAERAGLVADAIAGRSGIGTTVAARERRLAARKLWIAFAQQPTGSVVLDAGAVAAVVEEGASLLLPGVVAVVGNFEVDDAVTLRTTDGTVVAKGLTRWSAGDLRHARPVGGHPGSDRGSGDGPVGTGPATREGAAGAPAAAGPDAPGPAAIRRAGPSEPAGAERVVVHRDDLVVLTEPVRGIAGAEVWGKEAGRRRLPAERAAGR